VTRVALHTRLRAGAEEEYERAHREVPAELTAAIREAGAREWTIWRSGRDLFHVVEVEDYGRMLARLEALPVNVAWQRRVNALLEEVHDYSPEGAQAGLPVVWELSPNPPILAAPRHRGSPPRPIGLASQGTTLLSLGRSLLTAPTTPGHPR
jgi:L-rhamnose mutarotase